jgi:predicted RNA binding protein YcfA (HicA-like mRNA interferase family)
MKRREVEKKLKNLGWWFKEHGARHDIWTNGEEIETIPRHNEINEFTAKSILRNAEKGRRKKED